MLCYFNLYHHNASLKFLNGFLSSRGRIGSCTVPTQGAAVQRRGGGINVLQDHQRGFLLHRWKPSDHRGRVLPRCPCRAVDQAPSAAACDLADGEVTFRRPGGTGDADGRHFYST